MGKDKQRQKQPISPRKASANTKRVLDASPDRIDLRDWMYRPGLNPLPDELVNCPQVPEILDQQNEGACTGFALSAAINFLLHARNIKRRVSPRMLYELARRYDEWPGERYEGSSARGAMKGWVRHGVCTRTQWKDSMKGSHHLNDRIIAEAQKTPGGAYYRVMHKNVRDVHAALVDVGIVYATLMVHDGWLEPGPVKVKVDCVLRGRRRVQTLPVIQRRGRADSGHAVALVGYTAQGFIVQNSWGKSWGEGGFALLPYEDYQLHATDVWVAQLGVPVMADLWEDARATDTTRGMYRASRVIPLSEIRPYVINVGNNGVLSDTGDYWTKKEDLDRLFCDTIPEATRDWPCKRVMLYLHGGLNGEKETAARIIALRDVCLDNHIYPLHIMWETDWLNTLKNIFSDKFSDVGKLAGGGWLDNLTEGTDRVIEITAARPGAALWNEMKQNAYLASATENGAMTLVGSAIAKARKQMGKQVGKSWELHVVGHSAGSIFAAHALQKILQTGIPLRTMQFLAPAINLDEFKKLMLKPISSGDCPVPITYVLSDDSEKNDAVGPYRKSLLYLVSNAFEAERGTPLLGMQDCIQRDSAIRKLLSAGGDAGPNLIVAGAGTQADKAAGHASSSGSHGGFDNDPDTMNSVLWRILGRRPQRLFDRRDLKF
ncbi:MAG: C1 family peptidase [Gammaproteobacteria bacterium]|nr:C1 family peptidase [Gammaproteobacteria bacterium]MBU2478075.1 C1 family peptidase [Gammaproteobacteria bacterium]